MPASVVPGFGGLHVEVSSTALVGLGEGARYLVEYPYGCAEQKGSRAVALLLAADLGDAFALPGLDTAKMKPAVQATLKELERYQCSSGGFSYWPGACTSASPYLTAYLLDVFRNAAEMKYDVDRAMLERAYAYLERELAAKPPVNEGWWPAYTAWQAFAVKVLVEGGKNQDSNVTRLYGYRDRMPVFAIAYLHDALMARGEKTGARVTDLRRRMSNAVLPEAGAAHVEELADPYLLWFWNSNIRSTAIVLNSLVKAEAMDAAAARPMVRWLLDVREDGRWSNTQENAYAMRALVSYYRRFEPDAPNFRAVVTMGQQELASAEFRQRTAESAMTSVPMAQVLASGAAGKSRPLTFTKEGSGTLYYSTRLKYAVDALFQDGLDSGIHVERKYEPFVDGGIRPSATSYAAGDLVRVTLTFRLTKERRFVAVTDPLPAGFEAVESWFATTRGDLAAQQDQQRGANDFADGNDWENLFRSGGFDHVERHDNRVQLFATRLSEGVHAFSYIARATTAGTFRTAPARAEEMYTPEVFGRTATTRDRGQAVKTQFRIKNSELRMQRRILLAGSVLARSESRVPSPRSAAGGSARRAAAVHDRRGPQWRAALRGAERRRHPGDQAGRGRAAACAGRGDARGRGPSLLVASRSRSHRDRPRGTHQPGRAGGGRGRVHDHAAGGEAAAEPPGPSAHARVAREAARGGDRAAARAPARQTRDPRDVPEPRGVRQPDRRRGAREPGLLRDRGGAAHARAGGVSGGAAAAAERVQSVSQP